MSLQARVERLETKARAADAPVRFRVILPPKMTREQWRRYCREGGRAGVRRFTLNLDGVGCFDDEAEGGA